MVAKGVQAAQKQGFATGLGDGIREGQAENAEFFRECLEGVQSAFTFGG
jgi:flagellar biosynthesis/type III secretory pathway protein FliH